MRILLCAAAMVVLHGGCAQNLWNKPGASKDDFASDRYACLQGAQQ
ncbi:hypothetical protein [Variovorax sp. Root434]|nr:hypothetical protein [Variovorax sp. Root434]